MNILFKKKKNEQEIFIIIKAKFCFSNLFKTSKQDASKGDLSIKNKQKREKKKEENVT